MTQFIGASLHFVSCMPCAGLVFFPQPEVVGDLRDLERHLECMVRVVHPDYTLIRKEDAVQSGAWKKE